MDQNSMMGEVIDSRTDSMSAPFSALDRSATMRPTDMRKMLIKDREFVLVRGESVPPKC